MDALCLAQLSAPLALRDGPPLLFDFKKGPVVVGTRRGTMAFDTRLAAMIIRV